MALDNGFTTWLAKIAAKKKDYIKMSYERECEIINTYMITHGLSGLDVRMSLESIYKAFLKNPDIMLKS